MQIELVAALVAYTFAIAWLIRLESKVNYQDASIAEIKLAHKAEIEKIKLEHENEMNAIHESNRITGKAVWQKFDTLHNSLERVLQGLGRVEGKLEAMSKQSITPWTFFNNSKE